MVLNFVMIRLWRELGSRLWSSLPSNERTEITSQFNQQPSINPGCPVIKWDVKYEWCAALMWTWFSWTKILPVVHAQRKNSRPVQSSVSCHEESIYVKWRPNMQQGKLLSNGCLECMSLYWCCTGTQTAAARTCNSTVLVHCWRLTPSLGCHHHNHVILRDLDVHPQGPGCTLYNAIPESQSDVRPSLGAKGHIMPSPGFRGICMAAILAWWLCRWWCWLGSRFMPILPWP